MWLCSALHVCIVRDRLLGCVAQAVLPHVLNMDMVPWGAGCSVSWRKMCWRSLLRGVAVLGLQVGDLVVVDGGMVSLEVKQKFGPDVKVEVVDPGIVLSRANLTFRRGGRLLRARNSMLPVLSSKARAEPAPSLCSSGYHCCTVQGAAGRAAAANVAHGSSRSSGSRALSWAGT